MSEMTGNTELPDLSHLNVVGPRVGHAGPAMAAYLTSEWAAELRKACGVGT